MLLHLQDLIMSTNSFYLFDKQNGLKVGVFPDLIKTPLAILSENNPSKRILKSFNEATLFLLSST